MSDNTIAVGDLVMVVRALSCCGLPPSYRMFVVRTIRQSTPRITCRVCGARSARELVAEHPSGVVYELWRLRKINPPASGTEAQTVRERHEPKRSPVNA
jgi:hypothetical protein